MGFIKKNVVWTTDDFGMEYPIYDNKALYFPTPTPTPTLPPPTPSFTPTLTPTGTPPLTPSITPTLTITPSFGGVIQTANLFCYFDGTDTNSLSGVGATTWYSVSGSQANYRITLLNGAGYVNDYGGSVFFDGTNDYGRTNDGFASTSSDVSIEMWVQLQDISSSYGRLIGSGGPFAIDVAMDNANVAVYTPTTSGWQTSTTGLSANVPYHIVVANDKTSDEINVYVNSVNYGTFTGSFAVNAAWHNLGADYSNTSNLECTYGKLRVYHRNLTSSDVLNNWLAEKSNYGY